VTVVVWYLFLFLYIVRRDSDRMLVLLTPV